MSINEPTARWTVPLKDGNHVVEFEHGTATGKRIVKIDGKTIVHRDWMFRLVGDEIVMFGDTKFVIRVDPISGIGIMVFKKALYGTELEVIIDIALRYVAGLRYSYTLWVNGKSFKNFIQSQSKILDTWVTKIGEERFRIVLGKI